MSVVCTFKETVALTRDGYIYRWGVGNASDEVHDVHTKK